MLNSVYSYIEDLKNKSYDELLKERDKRIRELKHFEKWKKDIDSKNPNDPYFPFSFKDLDTNRSQPIVHVIFIV